MFTAILLGVLNTAPVEPLSIIRKMESNNGTQLDHKASPKGAFWTAFGDMGLKPSTAMDLFKTSPKMQEKYPIQDEAQFFLVFTSNTQFYQELVKYYWAKLIRLTAGDVLTAVYLWHYGMFKPVSDVNSDPYCLKFQELYEARASK